MAYCTCWASIIKTSAKLRAWKNWRPAFSRSLASPIPIDTVIRCLGGGCIPPTHHPHPGLSLEGEGGKPNLRFCALNAYRLELRVRPPRGRDFIYVRRTPKYNRPRPPLAVGSFGPHALRRTPQPRGIARGTPRSAEQRSAHQRNLRNDRRRDPRHRDGSR